MIDGVFMKSGMELREDLPEANPALFSDWLSNEVGQFQLLLRGTLDVGAYGAGLGLSRALQELSCEHLKTMGKPPHRFPKVDSVREAVEDDVCRNVVSWLLLRF